MKCKLSASKSIFFGDLMGKDAKEKNAFNTSSRIKQNYIEQLEKCKSALEFEKITKKYKEKKINTSVNLTEHHKGIIEGLDRRIQELTKKLEAQFTPKVSTESPPSTHEERDQSPLVEVLTEDPVEEESSLSQHQELGNKEERKAELQDRKQLVPTLSQSNLSFYKQEKAERRKQITSRHVQFELSSDESSSKSKNHKNSIHPEDDWSIDRIRRYRNSQLCVVKLKLKSLHTKQIEYKEKAKEYHRKKNQIEEGKYQKAADAAKKIYDQIFGLVEAFVINGDLKSFQANSQKILNEKNEDIKTLRTNRGWWEEFLDDLVNHINSGLTRVGSAMRMPELSLFKFSADGGNKINDLDQSIKNINTFS